MKKFLIACLVSSFLLAGCNRGTSQDTTEKATSTQATTESSTQHTEDSSNETQESSSSSSDISSSPSATSETADSSSAASTEQQAADSVSASEFGDYATFYFNGANVPDSININTNTNQITFNVNTNYEAVYSLTMQTVPVKTIRIFSANTNDIRDVKVTTMLSIGEQVSGDPNTNNQTGDLYLFHNKSGGISLATPNYAGNVSEDQTDVMLEALQ